MPFKLTRAWRWSWERELPGLAVVACVAVVYLLFVPPHVLGGDNGEFAILTFSDGIAHPPGYPLYVAWLRLLNWLPAASPAQAAGYATALLAVVQMMVLYLAARAWKVTPAPAAIAVAFYAGSPLAVYHYTHAEVFALNGLIVAGILLVCAPRQRIKSSGVIAALGILCGLGFSHHHSFVLTSPLILYGSLESFGRQKRCEWLSLVAIGLVTFFAGFSFNFLLFPWSQDGGVYLNSWGVLKSFPDFWWHFLRRDYGTFKLAASTVDQGNTFGPHMFSLLGSMSSTWKFTLILAPLAFCVRLRRSAWVDGESSIAWLCLLVSIFAAGPLFFSRANIVPLVGTPNLEVLQRFYLLPNQLLVIPVAEGVRLFCIFINRFVRPIRSGRLLVVGVARSLSVAAIGIYFFFFNVVLSASATRVSRGDHTEKFVSNGLRFLPPRAVLIVRADDEMFAGGYLQNARGVRPDLVLLNTSFLVKDWYTKRLSSRIKGCRWRSSSIIGFYRQLIDDCRLDVFVALADFSSKDGLKLYSTQPSYQYGVFRRLLPSGASLPSAEQIYALNRRLFEAYQLPSRRVTLTHGWASQPAFVYWLSWRRIASDMNRAGRPDLARSALQLAERYGDCQEDSCLSE